MPEIYCRTSLLYNRPNVVKGTKRTDSLSQEMRWPRPLAEPTVEWGRIYVSVTIPPLQWVQSLNPFVGSYFNICSLKSTIHITYFRRCCRRRSIMHSWSCVYCCFKAKYINFPRNTFTKQFDDTTFVTRKNEDSSDRTVA